MLISEIREEALSVEAVDRLLYEGLEDAGERADCVLVLGSLKAVEYRLPVAIEAYKAGRAGKLVLCGGKLRDFADGACSEAEHMRAAALAAGVPDADILLENASQNTVENILCAMVELQRTFGLNRVHSVLLVTTAYHMRRSLAIARHLLPSHIAVFPCPANDNNTRRENWASTPAGVQRARGEVRKLIAYAAEGIIPDFEVTLS